MGHVALLSAANKVLGKLRCSLQSLKSASEGSDDAEQASAVAILELKIAELEAKRQFIESRVASTDATAESPL